MKVKKILVSLLFTISIIIGLTNNANAAIWAPSSIKFTGGEDYTAPFTCFSDGVITFCRAHGKSLKGAWGNITYNLGPGEEVGDYIELGQRLAYAFEIASDNNEKQNIIWHLTQANCDAISRETDGKVNFKRLNTGSASVSRPESLKKAIKANLASNPGVTLNTKDAKTTIVEKMTYGNMNSENNFVEEGEDKFFCISKVNTTWKDIGDTGEVYIKVFGEGSSETIKTYKKKSGEEKLIDCGTARKVGNQGEHEIYIKYNDVKQYKNVKIILQGKYYNYSGEIAKYVYDKSSTKEDISSEVQTMMRINTKTDTNYVEDGPQLVPLVRPRIITTKYIKKIESSDGKELYSVPDSWNSNDWDYSNQKPTVTVDTSKDVDSKDRYNLIKQDTSKINLAYGNIITYNIRLYNIGNAEADMTDTSLKSTNKEGEEGNYLILKDGTIRDYSNRYLEYVGNGWNKVQNHYEIDATELTNLENNKLQSYEDYSGNLSKWSGIVSIKFKVIGEGGSTEINSNTLTIKNNGNETSRKDTVKKFLTEQKATLGDSDESNDYTQKFEYPTATVNNKVDINDDKRFKYNAVNTDPLVMQGDILTYHIRYYSIGDYATEIGKELTITDNFVGLEYIEESESVTGAKVTKTKTNQIKISFSNSILLTGYKKGNDYAYNETTHKGRENGIEYYDVVLKFKVNIEPLENIVYVSNSIDGSSEINFPAYNIEGNVFIDGKDISNGKTTRPGDAVNGGSGDKGAKGVRVDVIDYEKNQIAGDTEKDGIKYRTDERTKKTYYSTTYTDENGNYIFYRFPLNKIWKELDSNKNIEYHYIDPQGTEHVTTKTEDILKLKPGNIKTYKYQIKFTYNGQAYENVQYNVDNYAGKGSYSTEGGKVLGSELSRESFNNKFTTIDGSNSNTYTLMNKNNETDETNKYKNVSPQVCPDYYWINAYTGNNGYGSIAGIDGYTSYIKHVNLGLVKREFDLKLENRLDSMDVSINGVSQQFTSFNGGIISETIADQDVYFKEADYNAIAANGNSPIGNDQNKELSVWVNYTITVTNESKDNFIGILKQLDFYCDDRFDAIKVEGNTDRYYTPGTGDFRGKIEIPINGKELDNSADNGKQEIKISLHLSRATIKNVIEENDVFKTLETVAEIGSYSTKYNGDIYNNGHGKGKTNAGKVDEDSNAGNFDLEGYKKIRKTAQIKDILEMFNKEDDCKRSLGIILNRDTEQRKLTGIVFEDATNHDASANTRFGDGTYTENTKDKGIEGATVYFTDNDNVVKIWDTEKQEWKSSEDVKTDTSGKYTIEGFIPSKNYQIQFTYGDKNTGIYNAQDYKSTIDTTKQQYVPTKDDAEGNSPDGAENYWYSMSQVQNKSVAKDDNTKMDNSVTLTNEKALKLEDYKTIGQSEEYKNTAKTAKFYAPIRKEGNKGTNAENYTINNMNLGLAERPRSELTINKVIDHINITTSDGRVLIDGNKGTANSTTWFDRYVQPIIDENLIYGSTLQVTFRYFITNTGEVDYKSTGEVTYGENGIEIPESRKYYDLGEKGTRQEEVTTKPETIIDFADNGIKYNPDGLADPEKDSNTKNNNYWKTSSDTEKNMLDEDTKKYYESASVILTTNDNISFPQLKPGDTYGENNSEKLYLTLSKVLSTETDADGRQLQYINTTEILQQTNSVGRRSYHTTTTPSTGQYSNSNYTTKEKRKDPNDENSRIIGYDVSDATDRGNGENILLSEVGNRLNSGDTKINKNSNNDIYLVLTVPGDIGDPTKQDNSKTTLYWEPDADEGSIVIIPPFGNQKIIWAIIGTLATITLAGGIYLIKKKVL